MPGFTIHYRSPSLNGEHVVANCDVVANPYPWLHYEWFNYSREQMLAYLKPVLGEDTLADPELKVWLTDHDLDRAQAKRQAQHPGLEWRNLKWRQPIVRH